MQPYLQASSLLGAATVFLQMTLSSMQHNTSTEAVYCRDTAGILDYNTYSLFTCTNCYVYLYQTGHELVAYPPDYPVYLASFNGTMFPHGTVLTPDIQNKTSRDLICRTLNTDECSRWESCCVSAQECCQRKKYGQHRMVDEDVVGKKCPHTWDGFGCWNDTPSGQTVSIQCPTFIAHATPSFSAYKECTENATWWMNETSKREWSDYTTCLDLKNFQLHTIISVACNVASLLVLIPSIIILLSYRTLRKQHRVRLHIHLFSSFVLYSLVNILWDTLVVLNRLQSSSSSASVMARNTVGCRILYIMSRYSRSTNFLWMFCEAYFLHQLIVKAFETPKSLLLFYIIGWGFPWFPAIIYSGLRLAYANENCWVSHLGAWEWLFYVPNLLSLAMNFVFLINILRILVTQLQSHPNEPSSYRRALRATAILVPLFGLQLLMIIYRPPPHSAANAYYELMAAVITNSQGFLVAVILCLCNGEVLSHLRRSCKACPLVQRYTGGPRRSMTTLTGETEMDTIKYSASRSGSIQMNGRRPSGYVAMATNTNGANGYVT